MPENENETEASEQPEEFEAESTAPVSKAQRRWESHLADRYPHLPPPDVTGTQTASEPEDPEALQSAAEAVARGEAEPLDYSVAALARKLILELEKWQAAKQWISDAGEVTEVLEEGDTDGA
jgi:hypothetical protein